MLRIASASASVIALILFGACGNVTDSNPDAGNGDRDDARAGVGADAAVGAELAILTDELPAGNREVPYEAQLEATGGTPPYTWSASDVPPGLSASSDGQVTGTPGEPGTFDVTVAVTDESGATEATSIELVVANEPTLITDSIPPLNVFRRYEVAMDVAGGTPPHTFVASGLPPGLILESDSGTIVSDPAAPAVTDTDSSTVTITVTDDADATDTTTLSLTVIGAAAVAAGSEHSCALDVEGAAFCWGLNDEGQLGNGDQGAGSAVPVEVVGDQEFIDITAGQRHTCALDSSASLWCWGSNGRGQLGNDQVDQSFVPVEVSGEHTFQVAASGRNHVCALDEEGAAWCWGSDSQGQLGNGSDQGDSGVPVEVFGGHVFASITAGGAHSCALEEGGVAWCWGRNERGELGDGTGDIGVISQIPVEVVGDHQFGLITADDDHTCALADDGKAWCWGDDSFGQLGNDDGENISLVPAEVQGDHEFSFIEAGHNHTCAHDAAGASWCWGNNFDGQLGNDDPFNNSSTPDDVAGEHSFNLIRAGRRHTCSIDDAAVPWCWGNNQYGQVGNDDLDEISPVPDAVHPGPSEE